LLQRVAIALGSNLGNRKAALEFAVARLQQLLTNLTLSSVIETDPVGEGLEQQPPYLNAVVVGETTLTARELLGHLLAIERAYGRERPYPNAPRTLDLDLILLGNVVEQAADLHVPHPRFRERLFVLEPLAEIASDLVDPVTGLSVAELTEREKEKRRARGESGERSEAVRKGKQQPKTENQKPKTKN
jgi:2-amino-4-hydroxy-6-hydroxymethyldihydropteridine diphosphokinase